MKIRKKLCFSFIIISIFLILPIQNTNAKTLRDLKNELAALKQKKAGNEHKKQLTEQERTKLPNNSMYLHSFQVSINRQ